MTEVKIVRRRVAALMLSSIVALGVSVICSTAKAEDDASRFTYVRLHCTPDQQSHFTDVTIDLVKENFAPPAAPIAIGGNKPTSRAFIAGFGEHWGATDLQNHLNHPTPAVQLFTVLRGVFSITVTDGETRQLHAGDLVLLEDTTPCQGHITVVGDKPGFLLFAR
jgi:EutQ-like cupin domain